MEKGKAMYFQCSNWYYWQATVRKLRLVPFKQWIFVVEFHDL